jgi:hypothetical protein
MRESTRKKGKARKRKGSQGERSKDKKDNYKLKEAEAGKKVNRERKT